MPKTTFSAHIKNDGLSDTKHVHTGTEYSDPDLLGHVSAVELIFNYDDRDQIVRGHKTGRDHIKMNQDSKELQQIQIQRGRMK